MEEVTRKLKVVRISKPENGICTKICHVPYMVRDLVYKEDIELELKKKTKTSWKCFKCKNIWSESVTNRKRYQYCPDCQERKLGRPKCAEKECVKRSNFNYKKYDWAIYCKDHSINGMINVYKSNLKDKKNVRCNGNCDLATKTSNGRKICPHNNLTSVYPEILNFWDYEKNTDNPEDYLPKSNIKKWWKCNKNPCGCHKWEAPICTVSSTIGCSYCEGVIICPHNNLATVHPNLVLEWDYELNKNPPENYSISSGRKAHWICKNNMCGCHKWETRIYDKIKGSDCPYCCGKKSCRHNNFSAKYPNLALEWDYKLNEKCPEDYAINSDYRAHWICKNNTCGCHRWEAHIYSRGRNNGGKCPYCSGRVACKHNNFLTIFPGLAAEWDYKLNKNTPENYICGSSHKVHWICKNNTCGCHKWMTTIGSRTRRGADCPYCSGNKLCQHNNFTITHPVLSLEWDFKLNLNPPENYSYGSTYKAHWICRNNSSHKWTTTINSRTARKCGCPYCNSSYYSKIAIKWLNGLSGKNDIHIQHAENEGECNISQIGNVDGYCKKTNTIYEFHGDYWHGKPNVFDSNLMNPSCKKTYGQLYQNTLDRDRRIRELGYTLVTIWESEYK